MNLAADLPGVADRRLTTKTSAPHRRRLGALLVAAAVGLAGALGPAPTAQADSVAGADNPPLRFVSYNLCGNMCSDARGYDNQRRIDTVVGEATGATWNADQLYLQEVCRPQYDAIRSKLQSRGFQGLFTATLTGRTDVCGGSDYGVAVLTKGVVTDAAVLDLTVGGESEPVKVPCVKTWTQYRAGWGCSVHLYWNDATLRDQEAVKLAAQARQWEDEGLPVVLGGDFNSTPRSKVASEFYEPGIDDGGMGTFREADETDQDYFLSDPCSAGRTRCRSGEPTFGTSKIDYLFFSARHFTGAKADVLSQDTAVSDHRLLRGAAYWADCPAEDPDAGAVLRRDAAGGLFRYAGRAGGGVAGACKVGTGWSGMRLLAREGAAVLAVDGDGTLWRYPVAPATGTYSGSTRVQVGTGWASGDSLLTPGDFSGDGKPDLIGRDAAGGLWLYPGTATGGYGASVQIGTGWQIYDALLAPGDFSGDGKPDLIARDSAGALWLYEGNGASSYGRRTQIGTGWQIYAALAAPGDLDGDGRADLVGRDADGGLWFYRGNGASYYSPRTRIGTGYPSGELLF
ncbi:VCBS repeat-containing protein [Streptomyces actuosus]|uniref:VCBS repeat-containing protein n=1 Tax=Streptomyces actuosus TaxID=1885 RepID=A0ABS2VWC6_STRAS|nr:FG-GAP-like repeat-containing protein [Streptomyces actuosus]MBN0047439.1 VCBS repeat-containing protein [Streptomyces actuosus]